MNPAERLDQLEQQVRALLKAIDALRDEMVPVERPAPDSIDLQAQLLSIASYIALSPQIEDDELLTTILRCAMHVVRGGGAGLTLLDRTKNRLIFRAAIGDGSEGIIGYEVPVEGSQHGLAFATGEVQSATPIHTEIEQAAKAQFRNVLVAPLIVEGEPIGTMSAVNKQDGDHFTPDDMAAYKLFADLAALVVRQRVRETALRRLMAGDTTDVPEALHDLQFGKDETVLLSIAQDIGALAHERPDLVPLLRKFADLMLNLSRRFRWGQK